MKIKQLAAIIVTGIVIIAVGVTGVLSNVLSAQMTSSGDATDTFLSFDITDEVALPEEDFIGLINIIGEIAPSSEDVWAMTTGTYNHNLYMNYIDQNLKKNNHNKTIGLIICKQDNKYVIKYCSDGRIFSRVYELVI